MMNVEPFPGSLSTLMFPPWRLTILRYRASPIPVPSYSLRPLAGMFSILRLLMRILPYRTKENVIDDVVITFIDITDRKRALEQMRGAKNSAE